jgi:E3 ubiquitin-protein ligase RNF115/126
VDDETPASRTAGPSARRLVGSDSDPEEDDIEEIRFNFGRSPRPIPTPPFGGGTRREPAPLDPADAMFQRFTEMLNEMVPRPMPVPPSTGAGFFQHEETHALPSTGTRVHQTTFRFGPFGSATRVTVTNDGFGTTTTTTTSDSAGPANFPYVSPGGESRPRAAREPRIRGFAMPLDHMPDDNEIRSLVDQFFSNPFGPLSGGTGAGGAGGNNGGAGGGAGPGLGMPFPFSAGLQDLLRALYGGPPGVHGDHVYTQEDFDRIISQLMEQSAGSNAPPPASQAAIDRLERKKVDDEMLGPEGKAECTICIDELKKGEEVLVLPCKHWYHGECVTLWLREHNTCPMCRKPIEEGPNGGNNNNSNNNNNRSGSGGSAGPSRWGGGTPGSANQASRNNSSTSNNGGNSSGYQSPFSFAQHGPRARAERERERRAERFGGAGMAGSSRRRSSISPSHLDGSDPWGGSSRRRSPSPSWGHHEPGGGGGALGWLRDHFGAGRGR